MLFNESGGAAVPVVIILHGGGLSDWSVRPLAQLLTEYRVVTPVTDGHGADAENTFVSIADSAQRLLRFIDEKCGGHVAALCGLSLGAQIAVETLCRRPDVAGCALIESALLEPMPLAAALAKPTYACCYGLIKSPRFARAQARSMALPDEMFADYYADSCRMSRESLVNLSVSNARYQLDAAAAARCRARVAALYGARELAAIQRSARALCDAVPGAQLNIAAGAKHGEFSLCRPNEYVALLRRLLGAAGER